jgi:hypothetical protein
MTKTVFPKWMSKIFFPTPPFPPLFFKLNGRCPSVDLNLLICVSVYNMYRLSLIKYSCIFFIPYFLCPPPDDHNWIKNGSTLWPKISNEDLVDYLIKSKAYDGK